MPLSRADSLFAEVDMLDEHDLAVIVFDDVVAAEPIAVLIEIVGTLGAGVALDAQDRLADLLSLKTLTVVARTAADQPWIAIMGKRWVRGTYHSRSTGPLV